MKWQPIDTAPKDGSNILLLIDGKAIQAKWELGHARWYDDWMLISLNSHGCGCCGYDNPKPTAWAPLPEMEVK